MGDAFVCGRCDGLERGEAAALLVVNELDPDEADEYTELCPSCRAKLRKFLAGRSLSLKLTSGWDTSTTGDDEPIGIATVDSVTMEFTTDETLPEVPNYMEQGGRNY